jgi:hypothetical protein
MNSNYLEEASPELQLVLQSRPAHVPFFSKIRAVIHYYKIFCKNKAQLHRE